MHTQEIYSSESHTLICKWMDYGTVSPDDV